MELQEKKLYHQIHPVKLLTDWVAGVISLYFLWYHQWVIAFIIMFVPPIIVSFYLVRFINLSKSKNLILVKYIGTTITPMMETIRTIGFIIMVLGAWLHLIWLMIVGLIVILYGWFKGAFTQHKKTSNESNV